MEFAAKRFIHASWVDFVHQVEHMVLKGIDIAELLVDAYLDGFLHVVAHVEHRLTAQLALKHAENRFFHFCEHLAGILSASAGHHADDAGQ